MATKTPVLWSKTLSLFSNIAYRIPPIAFYKNVTSILPDARKDPLGASIYAKKIETQMMALPIVKKLQLDPKYEMVRAWNESATKIKSENASKSPARSGEIFTAQTLKVPGGIPALPIVFTDLESRKSIAIVHVGRRVTGFPMLVHGGVIATLLDEGLGRVAILGFPVGAAVTANLKVDYLAMTIAHQFIVVKTQCDQINEAKTKANVSGTVETFKGKVLAKSTAIFVVPKKFTIRKMENY